MNCASTATACSSARSRPAAAARCPKALEDVITILKAAAYDLIIIETPGIGQGDAAIVPFADVSMYVMTPEFGAQSQLEKIDMLDFADLVAINKFERRGAMDALRDVGRQLVRNRGAFGKKPEDMPVFGTSAATFNDDGVTALYQELRGLLVAKGLELGEGVLPAVSVRHSSVLRQIVPAVARPLPLRDRRHRPWLPLADRGVCRPRPSRAAARVRGRRARCGGSRGPRGRPAAGGGSQGAAGRGRGGHREVARGRRGVCG